MPSTRIKIGDRFGQLTVCTDSGERRAGQILWRCQCSCGNEVLVDSATLRRGCKGDCGCTGVRSLKKDLTGKRFGRLTVIGATGDSRLNWGTEWYCTCDCGKTVTAFRTQLVGGTKRSCGCLNTDRVKERLELVDGTSIRQLERNRQTNPIRSNTSGHRGVYFHRKSGKWSAQIQFKKQHFYLGIYDRFEEAVKAREAAEQNLFDGFLDWYYQNYKKSKEQTTAV